jgi:hypothetical protein
MVLLFPSRDASMASIANQNIDQAMDESVDQNIHQPNDIRNNIPNAHGPTEPVVTSHGKLCLWCKQEGTTYESEDIQELQDKDDGYDSGYENNGHANDYND